jgi:hypothetical protein
VSESKPAVRGAAVAILSFRIAYGVGLLVAPEKLAGGRWLGAGAGEPAAQVALRGLGAREVGLHGLALVGLLRGQPVRPLLGASIAGDLSDVASTAISRQGLPAGSAGATAAVAGGSALLTAVAAALLDE